MRKIGEKGVCAILLIGITIIFYSTYWNRIIPYTDGWGISCAELIFQGKVPYKDFYYYLPPLNLLMDAILWKLSFGYLIIYRLIRCIERLVIVLFMYLLLCRVSRPKFSFLASFLGMIISTSTVYDLLGDYNQTWDLVILILIFLFMKYIEYFEKENNGVEYRYLFFCGIVLGISFLLKQNLFVSAFVTFFLVLTVLFILSGKKNYWKSIGATAAGAMLVVSVAFVILASFGALIPFLEQVYFGESGKGSIWDILLSGIRVSLELKVVYVALIVSVVLHSMVVIKNIELEIRVKRFYTLLAYSILLLTIAIVYGDMIKTFLTMYQYVAGLLIIGMMIFVFLYSIFLRIKSEKYEEVIYWLLFCFSIVCTFESKELSQFLYKETASYTFISGWSKFIHLFGIIFLTMLIYNFHVKNNKENLKWIMLVSGGLVCSYATAMTCNDSYFSNRAAVILLPIFICYLLELKVYTNGIKNAIVINIGIILCVFSMAQKVTNAYSWWGWSESVISKEDSYSIDIPALRGFQVSYDVKNMYEVIYKVLQENTDEDSRIYGFPHMRLFNILCDNYNMNNFVPIPFYDVCSDEYARMDAVLLRQSPPDIVIWCDMPTCMEVHEEIFRNGDALGQRDIQAWFSEMVFAGEYELIGQYNCLFIYKNRESCETKYTYYKDVNAVNSTLSYN